VDSRAYIFNFPIEKPEDVPVDFRPHLRNLCFEAGTFIPQAGAGRFPRESKPQYPARLLLLNGQRLHIIPHPASDENSVELDLKDLLQFEVGNNLLLGWIDFDTKSSSIRLDYNTGASLPLERFLTKVRTQWLHEFQFCGSGGSNRMLGEEMDIKFDCLLHDALDSGETTSCLYFCKPARIERRFLLRRRLAFRSGHLLAATSRGRLVWLKDEDRDHYQRYAAITVSVPLDLFRKSYLQPEWDHHLLVICLGGDRIWRIPVYSDGYGALRFSELLAQRARELRRF
jgi:hypothetical protein